MKEMVKRLVWGYNIGAGVGLIALYCLLQYLVGNGSGLHWWMDGSVWLAGLLALFIFWRAIAFARRKKGAHPAIPSAFALAVIVYFVCWKWEPNAALVIESVVLTFLVWGSLPKTDDQDMKHFVASVPVFLPFAWVANLGVLQGLAAAAIWAIIVLFFAPWDAEPFYD
jgi:hypothetical protein